MKRSMIAVTLMVAFSALLLVVGRGAYGATTYTGNFNSMSPGTIDGQQGWSATNTNVDQSVVTISAGHNVFRMSNAYGSGSFFDYPFGPGTDLAGEPATGAINNNFQMALSFQSATGAAQTGLFVGVGPAWASDTSKRQGTFFIYDNSGAGLNVLWEDYVGGTFTDHLVGFDLSYTAAHTLSASLTFVPGANNDVAQISVDGNAAGTFTDYEGIYGTPAPANTVLFKTFANYDATSLGGSDATISGHGLYFDNLSYSVSSVPEPATMTMSVLALGGLALIRKRK